MSIFSTEHYRPRLAPLALGLATLLGSPVFGQKADIQELRVGETTERKLNGSDEGHFYTVPLKQGQVMWIEVRAKGADVLVVVARNGDERPFGASDVGFAHERETLTFIAEKDGKYLILIRAPKLQSVGSYQLVTHVRDMPTTADKERIQAERFLAEGVAGVRAGAAEGWGEAVANLERALSLWEKLGEKYWVGYANNYLGQAYFGMGEKQKALSAYRRSLQLSQAGGDEIGAGTTLNNIGLLYSDAGERREALNYYNQALALLRTAGDTASESMTLNNIGAVYDDLGEKKEALKHYEQALKLFRQLDNKYGEAMSLNNIGKAYAESGSLQKGLDYLRQSLAIARESGNKIGEAAALNNISNVSRKLDEKKSIIDELIKSLQLTRETGNRSAEASLLSNIGYAYVEAGNMRKGLDYFNQVLPLLRAVGDRQREAEILNNLMIVWEFLGNRRLAIFYGKLAINKFQDVRASAQGLDHETQKSLLRSIESFYRILAQIMIAEGQLEQAVQVLTLYKDQQFFDFGRDASAPAGRVTLSTRERELAARYEATSDKVGQMGSQLEEWKRRNAGRQPVPQEAQRVGGLRAELEAASGAYDAALKQAEAEFSGPASTKDAVGEVADITHMRSLLRQLNLDTGQKTAAIYTVVSKTQFDALVVTADGVTFVTTPVGGEELNGKARQLWALLQSPDYDPTKLSNELYNIVFKRVEEKLPKDTKTIIWSLDGSLRYLPMAALYDGKQYLIERYSHVVFTRAERERLTRAVSDRWTGYGFAASVPRTVEAGGRQIEFGPLDFIGDEMQIFRTKSNPRGIIYGEVFSEARFTKLSLLTTLKQRRPVVHISSHFKFHPGDEHESFLLLGDGQVMTLAEMKGTANLFQGVELLTLSACDTAAQRPDATGREIDGFAELAQRLGAGGVMASLWAVLDRSTAQLMKGFYANREGRRLNKAEALRNAQLDLLYGRGGAPPHPGIGRGALASEKWDGKTSRRSDPAEADIEVEAKYRVRFRSDGHRPFAHPYYWSSFVLFGNWR